MMASDRDTRWVVARRQRAAPSPVPAASAPVVPDVDTDFDADWLLRRFPPYRVILHNDDVHSTDEVVLALCKSVPSFSQRRAILIMLQAHVTGRATVVVCSREEAEYYAERLGTFGLTVTIEATE